MMLRTGAPSVPHLPALTSIEDVEQQATTPFVAIERPALESIATEASGVAMRRAAPWLDALLATTPQTVDGALLQKLGAGGAVDRALFDATFDALRAVDDPMPVLRGLAESQRGLAEALLLYLPETSDDLAVDKARRQAATHLVINTSAAVEGLVGDGETLTSAHRYARALGYFGVETAEGRPRLLGPGLSEFLKLRSSREPSRQLNQLGSQINKMRFGKPTVLPPDCVSLPKDTGAYDMDRAYWTAALSNLAYADEPMIASQLESWGFENFKFIDDPKTDTQGFVATKNGEAYVSFRGTSSLKDFKTDAKFRKTDVAGGRVHRGFAGAADSVWPQVEAALKALGDDIPVCFSGHSLGAALAQLAAVRAHDAGIKVQSVYNFGSPRVGNADWARYFNERLGSCTHLHINDNDVVTRGPPRLLGYEQVGQVWHKFDGNGAHFTRDARSLVRRAALEALEMAQPEAAPPSEAEMAEFLAEMVDQVEAQDPTQPQAPDAAPGEAQLEAFFRPIGDHLLKSYLGVIGDSILDHFLTS